MTGLSGLQDDHIGVFARDRRGRTVRGRVERAPGYGHQCFIDGFGNQSRHLIEVQMFAKAFAVSAFLAHVTSPALGAAQP